MDTGYAVWPKGQLVALQARDRGEFATVGIIPPKRKLHINLKTRRGGGVLVEAAALNGKPLAGRSFSEAGLIFGDHFRAPVNWNGQDDIGHQDGAGVIFRFRLDRAEIFGLEFS